MNLARPEQPIRGRFSSPWGLGVFIATLIALGALALIAIPLL